MTSTFSILKRSVLISVLASAPFFFSTLTGNDQKNDNSKTQENPVPAKDAQLIAHGGHGGGGGFHGGGGWGGHGGGGWGHGGGDRDHHGDWNHHDGWNNGWNGGYYNGVGIGLGIGALGVGLGDDFYYENGNNYGTDNPYYYDNSPDYYYGD